MSRQMKDSGIPWIGEIPDGWRIERIKTIFTERTELSENGNEELLSVSEYYGVDKRASRVDENETLFRSDSLVGYKKCYKGDFVSNIMLAWKGSFGITEYDGVVSPAYCVYKPSDSIFPKYYHYLFRTSMYTGQFRCYSKGIIDSRLRLYSPYFYDVSAIIPPLEEQQRIADFLDQKCGEVDEMVSLQEKIIEELKAYKQAIITEAVCKGLNPDAEMKDSGVEWIGKIPEGWEVEPFKQLYELGKGLSITKADLVQKGIPVISYGQIHSKSNTGTAIKDELIRFVPDYYLEGNASSLVKVGDLIFADTSEDLDGCGNCIYIDRDITMFAGYHTIIAKYLNDNPNNYFSYLFKTDCWRIQIRSVVNGVKVFSVPQRLLGSTSVIVPPIEEQKAIGNYLDSKCSDIDAMIAIKQQKIEELKDYKKSIIYEYITGKKEVV